MKFQDYLAIEKLHESTSTTIWRAQRTADDHPVILKIKKRFAGDLKNEAKLLSFCKNEHIVSFIDLKKTDEESILVLEDDHAVSLKKWLRNNILSVKEFLTLSIQIVKAVESVHNQGIIHKDLNPSNMIIRPDTGTVKLIDFQFAERVTSDAIQFEIPKTLQGTIAYLSPEQTGRVNKSVDYCSDLYSLGISFYELLTGTLPFVSEDPLEVVHAHLALVPKAPHHVNPDIPKFISNLIMKLLEKNAEERYQSAFGLSHDLEKYLNELKDFPLGEQDFSQKLQISQKLYGRDQEQNTLMNAYGRAAKGQIEIMMLAGYSGIGKSVLVKEIYKILSGKRIFFIGGKFDQLRRNTPYSALVSAFGELIQQLLTENEAQLEQWKQDILEALGSNGQIIIDVIPQVEWIIGKQAPVPTLEPAESQNRFNRVFQNFIQVFCRPEHPLVIFLDDMQWADNATLKFLEVITGDNDHTALFLIGAYRDNEVDPTHPLLTTLNKLAKQGVSTQALTIKALNFDHINQLIADSLHRLPAEVEPLTTLVMHKTGGNPFFVNQFLHTLYDENLLALKADTGSNDDKVSQFRWQWDIEQIEALNITDNVVELMIGKLKKLPESSQHVLRLAACMGSRFDLDTLSVIHEKSVIETFQDLLPALTNKLLLPLSEPEVTDSEQFSYTFIIHRLQFLHDRVQQAAYALIGDGDKQAVHLKIGRLLLNSTADTNLGDQVFEIVGHFNQSIDLLDNPSEKRKVAELNLQAGQKAKSAAAYQAASDYLSYGHELLNEQSWADEYALTLNSYTEAAEAAYLLGDYDKMNRLADVLLQHVQSLADELRICEIRILAFAAQNRHKEAITTALQFLQRLDICLPEEPTPQQVESALLNLHTLLSDRPIQSLINLPVMTDPDKIMAMRIMMAVGPAAYHVSQGLLVLQVTKQVELSLAYGNVADSSFSYVCYGFILCGVVGDIEAGYQFGQLGLELLKHFGGNRLQERLVYLFNGLISLWKKPIADSLTAFLENYRSGLNNGNIEYSAYSIYHYFYHAFFIGKPLDGLTREMALYSGPTAKLKQESILGWYHIFWQAALNLTERSDRPNRLLGRVYNEDIRLPLHEQANDRIAIHYLHLHKTVLNYLFQEYAEAIDNADIAAEHSDSVISTLVVAILHFYDSLARLAVYPALSAEQQREALDRIHHNQRKMKQWADHAPMNYLHKYYLVEAELARVQGKDGEAREYYDKAVDLAREHEYINEEAVANELAGRFYLQKGKAKIAHIYLHDAHSAYQRWGATVKVKQMEIRYPQFLTPKTSMVIAKSDTLTTMTKSGSEWLDLKSIMKAGHVLSGEIVLHRLLEKMIRIVIENTGAEKGFLLLPKQNNRWFIEAEGHVDGSTPAILQSLPIDDGKLVSASIIHYVSRSRENVVLHNASHEGAFQRDQYIAEHKPKSILCVPLVNQTHLTGILYLENNLTTGAFTSDRLEVLSHLTSQIAISIENSLLYERLEKSRQELEKKVEERTAELNKSRQAAELLARIDPLTELCNRRAFYEHANTEIERLRRHNRKLSVIMMDIDFFKKINDQHGHNIGDLVLKEFAKLIASEIRNTDIAARFGGEEFVILLSETGIHFTELFAERLRKKIMQLRIQAPKKQICFTSSFGIAEYDKRIDNTIDDVLFRADNALYDAKNNGRNRIEKAG